MLSHNSITPVMPPSGKRESSQARTWQAIEATLNSRGAASTVELAGICHQSIKIMRARLAELRSIGQVRHSSVRGRRNSTMWELGEDPTYNDDELLLTCAVKAEPFIPRRDPLVAALFGQPAPCTSISVGG